MRVKIIQHDVAGGVLEIVLTQFTSRIGYTFLTNYSNFTHYFLGTKCDVCVLSEETQVFRLVDAILESNLWPLAESEQGNDLEEVEEVEDEGLEDLEEVNEEVNEEVSEEVSGEVGEEVREEVSEDEQEDKEREEEISPVAACNKIKWVHLCI